MRKFEKIDYDFYKKLNLDYDYNQIKLPMRATSGSAGYDFFSLENVTLKPNESYVFNTGIKVMLNHDECLYIYIRSSLGFKYNFRLVNQVGIIDSDYYNNNANNGHIMIKIINEGNEEQNIKIGDRIAQGIFTKILFVEDDNVKEIRVGGIGSTNQ